jgi:hypothetical protein
MTKDQAPTFEIAIDNWRLRNYRLYRNAMRNEDFEAAWAELEHVIVVWPYSKVPNFETFDNLTFAQIAEFNRELSKALGEAFAQGN